MEGAGRTDRPGGEADRAVAALYCAHYRSLVRIAALLLGNGEAAEEVAQDAFVAVACAWRQLRDGDEALRHLRRAVITRARSRGAASPGLPGRPCDRPAPGLTDAGLGAALLGLPARQREALVLRYYAGWPDPQIASAMGISRRTVDACIRRGMAALQARLGPEWAAPGPA